MNLCSFGWWVSIFFPSYIYCFFVDDAGQCEIVTCCECWILNWNNLSRGFPYVKKKAIDWNGGLPLSPSPSAAVQCQRHVIVIAMVIVGVIISVSVSVTVMVIFIVIVIVTHSVVEELVVFALFSVVVWSSFVYCLTRDWHLFFETKYLKFTERCKVISCKWVRWPIFVSSFTDQQFSSIWKYIFSS